MILLLIIIFGILLIIVKYILPTFIRYLQLKKDYQNISFLPFSSIPFVGNLHLIDHRPYIFFQLMCRLSHECQIKEKGIFCLWYSLSPVLYICSANGLETFINNSKQLIKSFDYIFLQPWLKTGLVTSNNDKWRTRRRLITPSFHNTELLHGYMHIFNEQSFILADRFNKYSEQSYKTHDLYPCISACTLDIIAEAATGTHLKAQLDGEHNDFVQATVRIGDIINKRLRSPWLWPSCIFNRLPIGREHTKLLNILHSFSRKIIEERLVTFNAKQMINNDDDDDKKCTHRLVFLDCLLTQMQEKKLSFDDIHEEVDTFMFAGHDTTAAAINFFCYLMGCYPDIQSKVHTEMDMIFENDRNRPCTIEDIEQMTYLDCVIKECMRILPPVPFISREAQTDFIYRNQIVRKGTTVSIFIYGIHHDESVFPNPKTFDPERFLDNSFNQNQHSHYAFIPFSAGSRNCIGQRFAGLEERVVLSTLFRQFIFRSTQTIDQLHLSMDVILRPHVPIQMFIERRSL
ncbi:unnamed protein product [Adineta steineri]|uniref:Uncharacterized protein n=1 Tax=Adineta steineri TaxID=433720 RepID=A0A816EGH4_9BILA|nr:unnamed protein product [Adineta steineri]CAF1649410.1 unnamed protein product [Adineta steineri]